MLLTFLFQITFYVAFFSIDVRRIESKRNSILPCIVHESFTQKFISPQEELPAKLITKLYSNVVLTGTGKVFIVVITIVTASFGIVGLLQLQQWFDPAWFIPNHSYLSKYIDIRRSQYPDHGYEAFILTGDFNYTAEFPKLITLAERFKNLSTIQSVNAWPNAFAKFVMDYFQRGTVIHPLVP